MISLLHIDHLVITVKSIETTCTWYRRVLNAEITTFADNRKALVIGSNKINLHEFRNEFEPKALQPTCGSGDFCLICETPMDQIIQHLDNEKIKIEIGPTEKTGATGTLLSVYIRDPDKNLVEISNLIE